MWHLAYLHWEMLREVLTMRDLTLGGKGEGKMRCRVMMGILSGALLALPLAGCGGGEEGLPTGSVKGKLGTPTRAATWAGAEVTVNAVQSDGSVQPVAGPVRANEEGRYTVPNVPPGRNYLVVGEKEGNRLQVVVPQVVANATTTVKPADEESTLEADVFLEAVEKLEMTPEEVPIWEIEELIDEQLAEIVEPEDVDDLAEAIVAEYQAHLEMLAENGVTEDQIEEMEEGLLAAYAQLAEELDQAETPEEVEQAWEKYEASAEVAWEEAQIELEDWLQAEEVAQQVLEHSIADLPEEVEALLQMQMSQEEVEEELEAAAEMLTALGLTEEHIQNMQAAAQALADTLEQAGDEEQIAVIEQQWASQMENLFASEEVAEELGLSPETMEKLMQMVQEQQTALQQQLQQADQPQDIIQAYTQYYQQLEQQFTQTLDTLTEEQIKALMTLMQNLVEGKKPVR